MAVEKKFIEDGVRQARVDNFLTKELKRAGYGGMEMKPGIVIGKGGKVVRQLTADLANNFGMKSPQIEVQQVANPSFSAQIMAERLANSLERGWYFRKAGSSVLRRVMESGALGCQVVLSGKVTGARSRVQKFTQGYVKHAGEPSETIVEHGFAVAVKKLGTIGVQVKIVPPDAKLPDYFEVLDPEPEPVAEVVTEQEEEFSPEVLGEEIDAELEAAEDIPKDEDF